MYFLVWLFSFRIVNLSFTHIIVYTNQSLLLFLIVFNCKNIP